MCDGCEMGPDEFVEKGARWTTVRAMAPSKTKNTIDVFEFLRGVEFHVKSGGYKFDADSEWVWIERSYNRDESSGRSRNIANRNVEQRFRRFYKRGSREMNALLRVIGAYVAEGSASIPGITTVTRFMFTLSQKDPKWLQALREDLLLISRDVHIGALIPSVGATKLHIGSILPTLFFAALCGYGSREKKLPPFCFDLDDHEFLILFEKMVEADGAECPQICNGSPRAEWCQDLFQRRVSYTTISQTLAAQVSYLLDQRDIAQVMSYRPSKKAWTLLTKANHTSRNRQLTKVERSVTDDYVYDLTVEDAHTFVDAMGRVLLHNTDSLVTSLPVTPEGGQLGEWKLEDEHFDYEGELPKTYMLAKHRWWCPYWNSGKPAVACKVCKPWTHEQLWAHAESCRYAKTTKVDPKTGKNIPEFHVTDCPAMCIGLPCPNTGSKDPEKCPDKCDKCKPCIKVRMKGVPKGLQTYEVFRAFQRKDKVFFDRWTKYKYMLRLGHGGPRIEKAHRAIKTVYDKRALVTDSKMPKQDNGIDTKPLVVNDPATVQDARAAKGKGEYITRLAAS